MFYNQDMKEHFDFHNPNLGEPSVLEMNAKAVIKYSNLPAVESNEND